MKVGYFFCRQSEEFLASTFYFNLTQYIFRPTLVLVKSELKSCNSIQILQHTTNDLMLVLLNYILDKHKSYLVTITIVINLK